MSRRKKPAGEGYAYEFHGSYNEKAKQSVRQNVAADG